MGSERGIRFVYMDQDPAADLLSACIFDNAEKVKRWLDAGLDTKNVADNDGDTPLHYSALNNSFHVISVLLEHLSTQQTKAASLLKKNSEQQTAFYVAAKIRNWKCVKKMAKHIPDIPEYKTDRDAVLAKVQYDFVLEQAIQYAEQDGVIAALLKIGSPKHQHTFQEQQEQKHDWYALTKAKPLSTSELRVFRRNLKKNKIELRQQMESITEPAEKMNAYIEALIPTTPRGKLFYLPNGYSWPSVAAGQLKILATTLQDMVKGGQVLTLSFVQNIVLGGTDGLKEKFPVLYNSIPEAPRPTDLCANAPVSFREESQGPHFFKPGDLSKQSSTASLLPSGCDSRPRSPTVVR